MKKTSGVMVFVIILLLAASLGTAGQTQGASIIVLKKGHFQVSGELVAVKPDSLVLLLNRGNPGADVSVNVRDIAEIRILRKSKALLGAGIGLLAGVAVAMAVVKRLPVEQPNSLTGLLETAMGGRWRNGSAVLLCPAAGAFVGLAIGGAASADKVYHVENMDEQTVKSMLKSLSQKARVKSIQ